MGRCRVMGTGLHTGLGTTPALRIEDHFPVLDAILAHRLRMRQRPTIRQEIDEIWRAGFKIPGMVLLAIGKFSQHIIQVVIDHQMMAVRTADDAI